jgi:hypothetical protein
MYQRGKSNRFKLLAGVFLLAVFLLPLTVSCKGEESTNATPTATGTDLLVDPIKLDAGYPST